VLVSMGLKTGFAEGSGSQACNVGLNKRVSLESAVASPAYKSARADTTPCATPGLSVRVVMTQAARDFIPADFGRRFPAIPVHGALLDRPPPRPGGKKGGAPRPLMGHIELARWPTWY